MWLCSHSQLYIYSTKYKAPSRHLTVLVELTNEIMRYTEFCYQHTSFRGSLHINSLVCNYRADTHP